MNSYRLSALRTKGWVRLGLTIALAAIPLAIVAHALGLFGDGNGGNLAGRRIRGGDAVLSLVLTFLAAWIVRGFAVRTHDEDSDQEGRHPPPLRGPPAASATNLRARPASQH